MTHPEIEILLEAVGGRADERTRRHVAECSRCRADVETMTRSRAAGAMIAADPGAGSLTRPPSEVWARIQRELDSSTQQDEATTTPVSVRAGRGRRSRSWALVAASVAAGVVIGASVATVVARDDGGTAPQATRTAPLEPLGDHVTSGTLALSGPPARESLSVELHDTDPGPGFLEVWLLDAQTGGMVSLGVLDGEQGTYAVPAGLDLTAYNQVDLSREPFDGNPAHSKVSLARGQVP